MDIEKFQEELDKLDDSKLNEIYKSENESFRKDEFDRFIRSARNTCIAYEIKKRKLREAFPEIKFSETKALLEVDIRDDVDEVIQKLKASDEVFPHKVICYGNKAKFYILCDYVPKKGEE